MSTDVIVIGGGPAGATAAALLARRGARVIIVDGSHPREKPCGGGLTHKAVECFPFLLDNPYPKKLVRSVELIASNEQRANCSRVGTRAS